MGTNDDIAERKPLAFQATMLGDSSGMYLEVPIDIVQALGKGRRPPVRVVINGVELRTTLAAYGGGSQIGLRTEIHEAAQVRPGDAVDVSIELDLKPRVVELPEDLAAALLANPPARTIFDGLSFTNRTEYVGWVTSAKRMATRQRRVAEAPDLLKSGRRTPLGK